MQEKKQRRPNAERSREMRARLMDAARALFVEKGYSETGTPEIVKRAEVTRGALYHHFADKADLFRAVVEAEAAALGEEIEARSKSAAGEGLAEGTRAFFDAMAVPGRTQLLLVDGPAVLGPDEMDRIDAGGGRASLRAGLAASEPGRPDAEINALSVVLSAAFDRAAYAVAKGADPAPFVTVLTGLLRR